MLLNWGVGEDSWESVPWTARKSNQSILKEINPEYSLEGLMLKLQHFGHLMWRANPLENTLMPWRRRRRGQQRMRWHHWLDGHEFEQFLGDSDGQGSLVCCSPWGCRVRHNWGIEHHHLPRNLFIVFTHVYLNLTLLNDPPSGSCHSKHV